MVVGGGGSLAVGEKRVGRPPGLGKKKPRPKRRTKNNKPLIPWHESYAKDVALGELGSSDLSKKYNISQTYACVLKNKPHIRARIDGILSESRVDTVRLVAENEAMRKILMGMGEDHYVKILSTEPETEGDKRIKFDAARHSIDRGDKVAGLDDAEPKTVMINNTQINIKQVSSKDLLEDIMRETAVELAG